MSWSATVQMEPVAKGRPRMTKTGHTYTPAATRDAESTVTAQFLSLAYPDMPFRKPLSVVIDFYFSRPRSRKHERYHTTRPDLDNLAKLVLDCGNGIIWEDDKQIVHLSVSKHYCSSEGQPGFQIEVEEI